MHSRGLWVSLILIPFVFLAACASSMAPTQPSAPSPLESIDSILQEAVEGNIAYNAPESMKLEQVLDLQLLLSPTASAEELKEQIVAEGQVQEAELLVTPLMKAELRAEDPAAFFIQAYHDSPEQVVLTNAPTEWRWAVTAKKPGDQVLKLTLYRQVEFSGQTYWRMVQTYQDRIHISVTMGQRLRNFDWEWLLGVLIPAAIIPAVVWGFRWLRNRKAKPEGYKEG